jgi:hypothetical protein
VAGAATEEQQALSAADSRFRSAVSSRAASTGPSFRRKTASVGEGLRSSVAMQCRSRAARELHACGRRPAESEAPSPVARYP